MDRINENLYIGDLMDAGRSEWLREGSPTAVLKLSHGDPEEPYPEAVAVAEVQLIDGPRNGYTDFERAAETLLDLLDEHVVFVHCAAGVSRSGSVSAAALAVRQDVDVDAALEQITQHRPVVNPHPHLRDQAERFVEEH